MIVDYRPFLDGEDDITSFIVTLDGDEGLLAGVLGILGLVGALDDDAALRNMTRLAKGLLGRGQDIYLMHGLILDQVFNI